jgi:hypothetical protein
MPALNWGMIQDGGAFEALMCTILSAEDAGTVLFGRAGKDAGQDARSADRTVVYQAKYRQGMTMDDAVNLAKDELSKIKVYRQSQHPNNKYWQNVRRWVLVANFLTNPNDVSKWQNLVVPAFHEAGLLAEYWGIETLECKLAEHADIREVFFGGENRVLVGLKEAHDLLSVEFITSVSLEKPMVGREREMREIETFAESADKRVLPLVGPAGIGKSRLLYEGLVSLSQKGWRVLWALPGTMARSSRWFHLLNGTQKTCIAIDNPDDPGLLRAIIEQLCTVERRNWKIIISFRTEKTEVLHRFQNNSELAGPLYLGPLEETESKNLLQAVLTTPGEDPWLHNVHSYTRGVPGWLSLIAELANKTSLQTLPATVDEVASAYFDSCINSIASPQRDEARTLIRWIALWGTLNAGTGSEEQAELQLLENMGLPPAKVRELLRDLVRVGLVHNWGVGKRLYSIEPLIIREHILSDWLLLKDNEGYRSSPDGLELIKDLVKGEIPAVERILGALSHLTLSRLDASEGFTFLRPIFNSMAEIAKDGTVADQYRLLDFVENAGAADPESALEVIIAIRQSSKEDIQVDVPPWGPQVFSHAYIVSRLPWCLYQVAEYVSQDTVARRYLAEIRELITLEDTSSKPAERGKGARELLKRLLCQSRNSGIFAQPASEIVENELENMTSWPMVGLLIESLLNPEREVMEYAAKWTLSISIRAFGPRSPEWEIAARIRARVFNILQESTDSTLRSRLWHVMAESHQQFHRMIMHGYAKGALVQPYHEVLMSDLSACAGILQSSPMTINIEEATHARGMWSWYLEYGRDLELVKLARQCENIYEKFSKWRLHEFFRFDVDENLAPQTERVASIFRAAQDTQAFLDFFAEANRYLVAAGHGIGEYIFRISALADELFDQFNPHTAGPTTAIISFVMSVLRQADGERDLAWYFVIRLCKKHLGRTKESGNEAGITNELRRLLDWTPEKTRLLFDLYADAHPDSIGILTDPELGCILEQENGFTTSELFILLGVFALVNWETVQLRLRDRLGLMRNEPVELSNAMRLFIRYLCISELRYGCRAHQIPIEWVLDTIADYNLDGGLLNMHELTTIREKSGFRFSMRQMVKFMRSRMELEKSPRPSGSFKIMPYDFRVIDWCQFDQTNLWEVAAFHEFCLLALEPNFTAVHWMPKYLTQIDPSGTHVSGFIEQYLNNNPSISSKALSRLAYLASAYLNTSEAWAMITRPICRKAMNLGREEREHIYFSLSKKETGVLSSMPGQVPDFFNITLEEATRMRDSEPMASPLREYREWAFHRAEADLKQARERAEEDAHG